MNPNMKGHDFDPVKKDGATPPPPPGNNVYMGSEYPEAQINYPDLSAQPVEGALMYPNDAPSNPHLARFVKKGFKDVWAAVLFLAVFLMTVIWGIVNFCTYEPIAEGNAEHSNPKWPDDGVEDGATVVGVVFFTFVVSVITATAFLILMRCFAKWMIIACNLISIALTVVLMVFCFIKGNVAGGILLIVMALLNALWLYLVRGRIAFSAVLLRASSHVLTGYPAIILVNFLFVIVTFFYMIVWCGAVLPPADRLSAEKESGVDIFLICLFVLILFWVFQVIPNVMHVTASGVVATWYFAGRSNMPSNPTLASLKRAMTTSFGSICFGSLIVAVLQFLRWLAEASRNNNEGMNFVRCVLICLLNCIEHMVEYFNEYAFVHVAVYGCGYIEAAKRTFALCRQCFFAALFNDCLITPTLNILTFAVSLLIGVVVGVIVDVGVGVVAFFIAVVVHALFFTPLKSSVTTIFVCFAEVPEALQQSDPELYAAIHAADGGETNRNAPPPV